MRARGLGKMTMSPLLSRKYRPRRAMVSSLHFSKVARSLAAISLFVLWPGEARAEDEWSKAISTGIKQEGGLTQEERAEKQRAQEALGRWRQSLFVGAGYEVAKRLYNANGDSALNDPAGLGFLIGYGVRGLGPRVSFQARGLLSLSHWEGRIDVYSLFPYSPSASSRYYDYSAKGTVSVVTVAVEAGGRVRPIALDSAWYLGLAGRLGLAHASGTGSVTETMRSVSGVTTSDEVSADLSGTNPVYGGVFETGFLLGEAEDWDLGVRGFFGPFSGELKVDAYLLLGWAIP